MERFSAYIQSRSQTPLTPDAGLVEANDILQSQTERWERDPEFAQLLEACKSGSVREVEAVLNKRKPGYFNLNARGRDGRTPLGCAVVRGDLELVNFLLSKGADMHAPDRFGKSPYQRAEGKPELRQAMDDHDARVFEAQRKDRSYSQWAIEMSKSPSGREILLSRIAPRPNVTAYESKMTPLQAAVKFGQLKEVAQLIAYGANIHFKGRFEGMTPYEAAASPEPNWNRGSPANHSAIRIFMEEVNKSIVPETQSPASLTIAQTQPVEQSSIEPGRWESQGRSRLMVAVCAWEYANAKAALLEKGADVNEQDRKGRTPLTAACENGADTDLVSLLLVYGADPNATDGNGRSARQIAQEKGYNWLTELFNRQ